MKIAVRVDGSVRLGMGNVYRSLALAEELRRRGQDVIFIMKCFDGSFDPIRNKGFPVFLINAGALNGMLNSQVSHVIRSQGVSLLINDVKDTEVDYMAALKRYGLTMVNFDDLGPGRHAADYLFDAFNLCSPESSVPGRNFGPEFVILRKEFLRQGTDRAEVAPIVSGITVMMGAANTGGLLDTVIRALSFLPETIHHHIILGNAVHDPEVIQMNHPGKNFTYHYQPENIARIFASSDLAITSGGMSMCEACALGVPTLVLPQVPHEMQNARRFRDRGAVVLLDPSRGAGEKRIANTIRELVSNRERRKTLSDNARKMVDGRGLQRIVECLAPHWEGAFRPPTSPNVFRRPNPSAP